MTGLPRDSVFLRKVATAPGMRYFAYLPHDADRSAAPVVVVHGIARDAREMIHEFVPAARRDGIPLIAPWFTREICHHYQQLGWLDDGLRADLLLQEIVREFAEATGLPAGPFALFGHSGGAQFAHRFALAWPRQVSRLATCAAGYYTFPDEDQAFPAGLDCRALGRDARLHLDDFLRVPLLATVGGDDTSRDAVLRKDRSIDSRQGRHRRERAERWVEALGERARQLGLAPDIRLAVLPGAGHRFRDTVDRGLIDIVWPWLTARTDAPATAGSPLNTLNGRQIHT